MWMDPLFLKYRTILNSLIALPQRAKTSFVGLSVTDDAPNDTTNVSAYRPSVAVSGTVIDCSKSDTFTISLTANTTFTLANMTDGQIVLVEVTDTNTSTIAFSGVRWSGGSAPSQTTNGVDVYTFAKIGTHTTGNQLPATS